jgi:hypothetical protein
MVSVIGQLSTGVIGGAELADHRHLYLARVLEILLQFPSDAARQIASGKIVDLTRINHDPDLSTCLHGEHLLDPDEVAGECFEALEPANVRLEGLAASTRAGGGHGIGRLDKNG